MTEIDFVKIWISQGYGTVDELENGIIHLKNTARSMHVPTSVAEAVVQETFIGLMSGEKYSKTKCPCGCGSDKPRTAIIHHMVGRVVKEGRRFRKQYAKMAAVRVNKMINKKLTYKKFIDPNRSEVVRLGKKIYGYVSNNKHRDVPDTLGVKS